MNVRRETDDAMRSRGRGWSAERWEEERKGTENKVKGGWLF